MTIFRNNGECAYDSTLSTRRQTRPTHAAAVAPPHCWRQAGRNGLALGGVDETAKKGQGGAMSEGSCKIWVERKDGEHQVEVRYEFTPCEPPSHDRRYPGTPAWVEIQETSMVLSVEETNRAIDTCWQDVRQRQCQAKEP